MHGLFTKQPISVLGNENQETIIQSLEVGAAHWLQQLVIRFVKASRLTISFKRIALAFCLTVSSTLLGYPSRPTVPYIIMILASEPKQYI